MSYIRQDTAAYNDLYDFCDYNNERAVLSLAIKDEDNFYLLLATAAEADFLASDTRVLFELLKFLHSTGVRKFDTMVLVKVGTELGHADLCTHVFLDALLNVELSKDNFKLYLNKLMDDSLKFKLYSGLYSNMDYVKDNAKAMKTVSGDDLLSKVQSDLLSLSMSSNIINEPKHIADGLDEYIESIQDTKVEITGLSSGYPIFDAAIDGLVSGTLTVIAARKKMGKSTFLSNIAANVAIRDGGSALYVDTEMSFDEWRPRMLSMISGVEERIIKHGGFKNDKNVFPKIKAAAELFKDSKLFHFYLPGYTVEKISALFKKYKLKENIDLGVFDYIKEPESTSTDQARKEHQILGDVTTKLKDLAGKLDIPFLAAVQLGRGGDVADSDRIGRYGDVVAFWRLRDLKEAEENAWDLDKAGYYGLSIKDSRRGGRTGEAGIGYHFFHEKLTIKEIIPRDQIEQFRNSERVDTGNFNGEDIDGDSPF